MGSDWQAVSLREAGVSLLDCEHRTPPAAETGYPYIAIPQMEDGRVRLAGVRRISFEHFRDWTKRTKPEPFDVVLSRRCNPGATAFIHPGLECALGQNLVLLRADGRHVFPPFLRWWVRSPEWWEQVQRFINVGAVFESLKCGDIPNFRLSLPPLSEQRRIAALLGALDDRIDLNRQMSRTLDEIAQAIFKSWFLDFDGHDDLVDSELGPIPRGWEVGSIYKVAQVVYGAPFKSQLFNDAGAGLPIIRIRDLQTHQPSTFTPEVHPRGTKIVPGDIVVGMDGEFRAHVWRGPISWLNQRMCHFRPVPGVPALFLLHTLHPLLASEERGKVGTTVIHLGKRDIDKFQVVIPPADLCESYHRATDSLLQRLLLNAQESDTLTQLRDTLLPKLITGEVRVPEAEKMVQAAT